MKVPWAGDRPRAEEYRASAQASVLKEWGEHMAKRLKNESDTVSDDTVRVWMDAIWAALSRKRSMREAGALYNSSHMWSVAAVNDYIRCMDHDLYGICPTRLEQPGPRL
jgi:hypothetical protein